jgi:uncharacterized protein YbjT (DUF2867 family)
VISTVLVTGPTGKVGPRLIPPLTRRGMAFRAASRSPVAPRAGSPTWTRCRTRSTPPLGAPVTCEGSRTDVTAKLVI